MAFEEYNDVDWTTTDLLSDVRLEASLPSDSSDYTDAVVLNVASQVIWSTLQVLVSTASTDGRMLRFVDRTINTDNVEGDSGLYTLPHFAVAETVSHVLYVDSSGDEYELEPLEPSTLPDYKLAASDVGSPEYYVLEDHRIRLWPTPASSNTDTLRIYYQRRHPRLVTSSLCMQTTNVTTGDGDCCSIRPTGTARWTSPSTPSLAGPRWSARETVPTPTD